MVHWENHVGDDVFETPETQARATWYGVSGIPHVRIDGLYSVIGAGSCASAAQQYRNYINQRIQATGGVAPVEIIGSWLPTETEITMQADFRLVDPATLTSLRATLLLYEDHCFWSGQNWEHTTRKIHDQNITLTNVGDVVNVATTIPLNPNWNPANLKCVAYLQQTNGNKQIIQGAILPLLLDFEFAFEHLVRSVPDGNGLAIFNGTVTNIGDATDTITLEIGTSFPAWTTRFYVCGDPNPHTTPVDVTLGAGQSCDIILHVLTDNVKEVRSGSFLTTSAFSGRTQTSNLKVFNGSPSVYLINDNANASEYLVFTQPLDVLGYLYDRWDINYQHGGTAPAWVDVSGYDIMIWETAFRLGHLPTASEQALMMQFMDAGGNLFFTSQSFLNTLNNVPNTFTQNYLGISSWTVDRSYLNLAGVAGDPIGNGLTLPLSFTQPFLNKGDHVVTNTAVPGLIGDGTSNALVHNILRGSKCVFMPSCFNAVSASDPDPNNQRVLLGRVLDWLTPEPAADAPEGSFNLASRIEGIRPNPFNPRTEIAIQLTSRAAAGSARLEIIDPSGRRVASLFEGALPAGTHRFTWDGISASGKPADSGVYFVWLRTLEGARSQKLVLLK